MKVLDKRIQWIALILIGCFLLLFIQLNNLQIRQASHLTSLPYNFRNHQALLYFPRGSILTSDGTILATSKPTKDAFKELREYPTGSLFSDIVGYDSIYYGVTGVEAVYNSYLSMHPSSSSSLGGILTSQDTTDDVILTLSTKLQQVAVQALAKYPIGAVVAIDPQTGAVLAMYGKPTYDPNPLTSHNISQERAYFASLNPSSPTSPLLSVAYQQRYAPGSTFKVVTSSAVYQRDPSLATKNYPYLHYLTLPQSNSLLHNFANEGCGGQLPILLEQSCDTGFGQIGLDLGANNLAGEAQQFGFNQVPPIDLTNVAKSNFPSAASFATQLPFLAYSAIGQGNVQATALQMAMVAGAVANDGVMMVPHVLSQIQDSLGQTVKQYVPQPWLYSTTPSSASSVTSDMELVASAGTASNLFPPSQNIAAKTGTAQTSQAAGNNNWLVAFGPNGNGVKPQVAVAAVVPYFPGLPKDTTGDQIAGPVVETVLETALSLGL